MLWVAGMSSIWERLAVSIFLASEFLLSRRCKYTGHISTAEVVAVVSNPGMTSASARKNTNTHAEKKRKLENRKIIIKLYK
jgi:hypothetical protein